LRRRLYSAIYISLANKPIIPIKAISGLGQGPTGNEVHWAAAYVFWLSD